MMRITPLLAATATIVLVAVGCARDTSAREILSDAQKRLATVHAIQLCEENVTTVAVDGKPFGKASTKRVEFCFKRPDMFVERDGEHETWVDGSNVVQYVPSVRRYSRDRLDAHLRKVVFDGLKWEWGRRVTNVGMVLGIDYVRRASSLERLADANVNGKSVYVLRVRMKAENNSDLTQTMWIGKSDHLVYKSETITAGPAPEAKIPPMGNPKRSILTVSIVTRLLTHRLNGPIPDAAFTFVPSSADRPFARPRTPLLPPTHRHLRGLHGAVSLSARH